MKTHHIIILLAILLFSSCAQDEIFPEDVYRCQFDTGHHDPSDHPGSASFQNLITEITQSGAPGMQLSVFHDENGFWSGAGGYADLASDIELKACNITRVGSTVKTFTAVSILLLQEDGLLNIDDAVTDYLSPSDIAGVENAELCTIRQLLQHSSGIFNYIQDARFQTASLNDLVKTWRPDELLRYARGKDPYFKPGSDVLYSNTNYILLGMIVDRVTGKPFFEFFEDRIFKPLGLKATQFAAGDPVPGGIIRGYVDFYSNLNVINATYYSGWDYYTADGGLISNAHDLNVFLTGLLSGDILNEASMEQLLSWREPVEQPSDSFRIAYGLGIFRLDTRFGPAYIHSGDAIGYYASMVYFPVQQVTITWAVNGNYGKIDEYTQSKEAMESIFEAVLEQINTIG